MILSSLIKKKKMAAMWAAQPGKGHVTQSWPMGPGLGGDAYS